MFEIHLNDTSPTPLFKQIMEQIKQLIATNVLQPGEHLPTIRKLADSLKISPGTVVRAYMELEQEGIVKSRHGGGTTVLSKPGNPDASALRQRNLYNIVSNDILEALSKGYSPDEIESAFTLNMAKWREERKQDEQIIEVNSYIDKSKEITIVGSHDLALNLLVNQLKKKDHELTINLIHSGSLGGLIALQENRADIAGIHLLDEETGEYNYPYVKHLLPGREIIILHLAYRTQGLLFAAGNPKHINALTDLKRKNIRFINRQNGSGTRVLLDYELRQQGITPMQINGYNYEVDTHLAVAGSIARKEADAGLGIEAAARIFGTGFLPLFRERYDLILRKELFNDKHMSPLLEVLSSEDFKKSVNEAGGYDTTQTGSYNELKL